MKKSKIIIIFLLVFGGISDCKKDKLNVDNKDILVGKWIWVYSTLKPYQPPHILETYYPKDLGNSSLEFTKNGHVIITKNGDKSRYRVVLTAWKPCTLDVLCGYQYNKCYKYEILLDNHFEDRMGGGVSEDTLIEIVYFPISNENGTAANYFVKEK